MTVDRAEIEKKVKKEYADMRKWNKGGHGRYSKLIYDASDGEIWADCFLDENSYEVYKSSTIRSVPINDVVYAGTDTDKKPLTVAEVEQKIVEYIIADIERQAQDTGSKTE